MRLPTILLDDDERLGAFEQGRTASRALIVAGWREWVALPRLGIARINAKLDSGAKTSALHADHIEPITREGAAWVRFHVSGENGEVRHEAPVAARRKVRSSSGGTEERFFVRTPIRFAGREWPIVLTLTNRERMKLPMLVGRQAMAERLLVDPAHSWLWERPTPP